MYDMHHARSLKRVIARTYEYVSIERVVKRFSRRVFERVYENETFGPAEECRQARSFE